MMIVSQYLVTVVAGLWILAGVLDLTTFRIPNWISLACVILFAVAILAAKLPWTIAGAHAIVFVVALVVGFCMFALGLIGGGDAKLFAVMALWVGPKGLLSLRTWAALSGGVLAVLVVLYRSMPRPLWTEHIGWLRALSEKDKEIPYGVALTVGGLAALLHTEWMTVKTQDPVCIAACTG